MAVGIGLLIVGLLAGCGGGGGSSESGGGGATSSVIQGQAVKGPFQSGSTCVAIQIGGSDRISGSVSDNLGNFSVTVPWIGPTKIECFGTYFDELNNNQPSTILASAPITAIVEAVSGAPVKANTNLITSIAAGLLEERQAAGTAISPAAILQANRDVAQAVLGQPVDNLGAIDLMRANADTNAAQLLAFQLSVAAAHSSTPNAAAKQLAKNLQNNRPFGASEDGTAINRDALLARVAEIGSGGNVTVGGGPVPLNTILTNLPGTPTVTNVRTGAGATATALISKPLSPFKGKFHLGCDQRADSWSFCQHQDTDSHKAPGTTPSAGGIGRSDDTLAWDINRGVDDKEADKGEPVFAVAKGEVAGTYAGFQNPETSSPTQGLSWVLIKHDGWWSAYLHMDNIDPKLTPGEPVDENRELGVVSNKGADSSHLHFVVYTGSNLPDGLKSFNVLFRERPDAAPSPTPPSTSPPSPPSGGSGGTLTLTGAPASTGGTFVADGTIIATSVVGTLATVAWVEVSSGNPNHGEQVGVNFDAQTGQVISLSFASVDVPVSTGWSCSGFGAPPIPTCSGVTVNRSAGTLTVANTVLADFLTSSPPITVNGTLTFPPVAAPAPTTPSPSPSSPPSLTVGPASLNFGDVQVGSCSTATFAIQHVLGTGPATGTVSVSPNSPFSLVSGSSFSVSNGSAANVSVRFCPANAGAASGTATVLTTATFTGASTVALSGTGIGGGGGPVPPVPQPPSPPPLPPLPPGISFGFTFTATPASQTVVQGAGATYTATATLTSGVGQAVSLEVISGCPPGATCFFNPTSLTPTSAGASSAFTVNTTASTPAGVYPIRLHAITGPPGPTIQLAEVLLTVTAAGGSGGGGGGGGSTVGIWMPTGSMVTARESHTATLLPNGKVLAVGGGSAGGRLTSAELYDLATGTWTNTGSLVTERVTHTATLLPNGKVLVVGNITRPATAELYDPATGTWTNTGSPATGRASHTATLLPNGKVLVAGGAGSSGNLASAELYDPATGTWTNTGSLATGRASHTATLLPNGKVLAAGGFDGDTHLASAELYDPTTGTWTNTGSLATGRFIHTATLLPNGKVLVVGGSGGISNTHLATAELYDSATGMWTSTGSLSTGRVDHTATLLPTGKVLVAGGSGSSGNLATAELYDPTIGTWTSTGGLATIRYRHTATLLPNGKVLAAGGFGSDTYLASAELYDPGSVVTLTVTKAGSGAGTVTSNPPGIDCGATCAFAFATGASVTLTANPSTGSTFAGWSGACTGTGTCTLSMTEAKAATATFTADASGSGTVEGIVQNFSIGASGVDGTDAPIANVSLAFRDSLGNLAGIATSGANGVYSLALPAGTYDATATASGFVSTTLRVEAKANQVTIADPLLIVQDIPGVTGGNILGLITDVFGGGGTSCITGCPLGGATVDLRRGIHVTGGPVVATTTSTEGTGPPGSYVFLNLQPGSYTVTASKPGYLPASFTAGVTSAHFAFGVLSPILSPNEVRIVLTGWTSMIDLNAHLTGPLLGSSSRFHVSLSARGSLTSAPFAALEAIASLGSGSETMTISQRVAGTYRFSAHNLVDMLSTTSSRLSLSNAQVRVYVGTSQTPVIFNVPPARPGTLWTVFEMDGATGVITPVNSLTFAQDFTTIQ